MERPKPLTPSRDTEDDAAPDSAPADAEPATLDIHNSAINTTDTSPGG